MRTAFRFVGRERDKDRVFLFTVWGAWRVWDVWGGVERLGRERI